MSVAEIASKAGIHRALLDAFLAGAAAISAEHARAVAETLDAEWSPGPPTQAEAASAVGKSLLLQGKYREAVGALERLPEAFASEAKPASAAAASQSLGYCYVNLGMLEQARSAFHYALANYPAESRWKAAVSLAALAERTGDFEEAELRLTHLQETDSLDPYARTYLLANEASLEAVRGNWKNAAQTARFALQLAKQESLFDQVIELEILAARAFSRQMLFASAEEHIAAAETALDKHNDGARAALLCAAKAEFQIANGDPVTGEREGSNALRAAIEGGYLRTEAFARILLAESALALGDEQAAIEAAAGAKSFSATHRYFCCECTANVLIAECLARLGNLRAAKAELAGMKKDYRLRWLDEVAARILSVEARIAAKEKNYAAAVESSEQAVTMAAGLGTETLSRSETARLKEYRGKL